MWVEWVKENHVDNPIELKDIGVLSKETWKKVQEKIKDTLLLNDEIKNTFLQKGGEYLKNNDASFILNMKNYLEYNNLSWQQKQVYKAVYFLTWIDQGNRNPSLENAQSFIKKFQTAEKPLEQPVTENTAIDSQKDGGEKPQEQIADSKKEEKVDGEVKNDESPVTGAAPVEENKDPVVADQKKEEKKEEINQGNASISEQKDEAKTSSDKGTTDKPVVEQAKKEEVKEENGADSNKEATWEGKEAVPETHTFSLKTEQVFNEKNQNFFYDYPLKNAEGRSKRIYMLTKWVLDNAENASKIKIQIKDDLQKLFYDENFKDTIKETSTVDFIVDAIFKRLEKWDAIHIWTARSTDKTTARAIARNHVLASFLWHGVVNVSKNNWKTSYSVEGEVKGAIPFEEIALPIASEKHSRLYKSLSIASYNS